VRSWRPLRASTYAAGFQEQVEALGFDLWLWDQTAPLIDKVLCGAERERLDLVYPPKAGRLAGRLGSYGLPTAAPPHARSGECGNDEETDADHR
jgi:hypothetical protein